MGHFVKNKKTFNAFIDRLINLDYDEFDKLEAEEHPNDAPADSSQNIINNLKSDKLN